MEDIRTAFLHYSAPPVIGGVEAVMTAHARVFLAAGYPVVFIAGEGSEDALPDGAEMRLIPEISTQHSEVLAIQKDLDYGRIPESFNEMRERLGDLLRPLLAGIDVLIVHNIFTKHFNLPLTAALFDLIEEGVIQRCISWGHDFTWTSPNSRKKVFPGYPWDLLKKPHPRIKQVTISAQRQKELAGMMGIAENSISVIYNGVDLRMLHGISKEGWALIERLDLLADDIIIILPVRVTTAKNIELAEQVVRALKASNRQPHLVITGPPDPHNADSMAYYQSLIAMREKLGVGGEVNFAFESGPDGGVPYYLSEQVVSDLMRVSDVLLLPSHREGFGMPVLEAGLIGLPVVSSDSVPAAREIGGTDVRLFKTDESPEAVARIIQDVLDLNPIARLRRRTRQNFRWERIFSQQIEPLLKG